LLKQQIVEEQTVIIRFSQSPNPYPLQSTANPQIVFEETPPTEPFHGSGSTSLYPNLSSAPSNYETWLSPNNSFFSYPELDISSRNYNLIQLEKEQLAFLALKSNLLNDQRYREKYVAILQGRVVDSDLSLAQLAKRVYEKHGYVPILMTKVTDKIRKFENSSPETRIS